MSSGTDGTCASCGSSRHYSESCPDREYPEHVKVRAVQSESRLLGRFLEWLNENEYSICEAYKNPRSFREGEYVPLVMPIETMLAKYFEIDLTKLEQEKQLMLDRIREANGG